MADTIVISKYSPFVLTQELIDDEKDFIIFVRNYIENELNKSFTTMLDEVFERELQGEPTGKVKGILYG